MIREVMMIIQGEDIYKSIPLYNPYITDDSVCVVLSESCSPYYMRDDTHHADLTEARRI